MKLIIKNGTIINPAMHQHETGDVVIKNGRILAVGGCAEEDPTAEVYDATGCFVTPGLIDMHVHLREPGQEAKEDIHTGTQAAAAGGVTRVATMANTTPVIDNAAVLRDVQERAEREGVVKVSIIGSVSRNLEGDSCPKWAIWPQPVRRPSPMTAIMWKAPTSCAGPWNMPICSAKWSSIMQRT